VSLGYCGSCGEPVEGRFCRMCGAPYPAVPAGAVAATAVQQLPSYQGLPPHRATHAQPPESDFESLFRPAPGEVSAYSHTQLIPPVEADYRMPPPSGPHAVAAFGSEPMQLPHTHSGDAYPPGRGPDEAEDWYDDEPRDSRKPVIWAAVGAVVAASAVILGLLYIGSHNNTGGGPQNNVAANTPTAIVSTQPTVGSVDLAPGSASPSPSPSPSASPSPSPSATAGGTTLPLSLGSTGQYVHYVQTRLRQLGDYQGPVNDQYDQATAQAVQNFQAKAGVTGDPAATVGRSTLTALIAAGSRPDLHLGQRSGDVKRLQEALKSAENAGLTVSGKYDAATMAAVGEYQQQVGLSPTGSMTGQTWNALQAGRIV
jgi:peptidoglycan hydrolase-like protein with peptidoglycan-binding domain